MSSILTNSAALSALQSLQMTQQSLATVENQVSTGLSVATAADNSSYWSIAAQLNNDSGIVTAANDALSEGQSVLATATSAINSVITTLNSMASALTEAQNPGAEIGDVNTSLASLSQQLTDAVNGASFNGLNVLNGTQSTLNFVSGFNASTTGGMVNAISITAQALTGGSNTAGTTSTTTVTSSATIKALQGLTAAAGPATYGTDAVVFGGSATTPETLTVTSVDAAGNTSQTVYTALELEWKHHRWRHLCDRQQYCILVGDDDGDSGSVRNHVHDIDLDRHRRRDGQYTAKRCEQRSDVGLRIRRHHGYGRHRHHRSHDRNPVGRPLRKQYHDHLYGGRRQWKRPGWHNFTSRRRRVHRRNDIHAGELNDDQPSDPGRHRCDRRLERDVPDRRG